jgi:hypothetical protein
VSQATEAEELYVQSSVAVEEDSVDSSSSVEPFELISTGFLPGFLRALPSSSKPAV